jgi:citrate lyase subunit beta / citryl-CoA lyase
MSRPDVFARGPAWLFCPADRPERYAKAAAAADVVIIDLEDGVSRSQRARARESLREAAATLDPASTVVRISPSGTEDHEADLALLSALPISTVMLAKAEHADQLAALHGAQVVALCETPLGVLNAGALASAENCVGLMWGAEDLIAAIGGTSSRHDDGSYRDVARHARAQVLLAAAAAGKPALDSVVFDLTNDATVTAEAIDAAASGFAGKACIHPRQAGPVRAAFQPSAAHIEWAHAVLDAVERQGGEGGAFAFRGQMVDEPVLRRARHILSRAEGSSPSDRA